MFNRYAVIIGYKRLFYNIISPTANGIERQFKSPVRRLADWGSHEKNGKIAFEQKKEGYQFILGEKKRKLDQFE